MDKTSKNLFNNTKLAFTNKSNNELKKAYFLFSILDYSTLTKVGNAFLILGSKRISIAALFIFDTLIVFKNIYIYLMF